MMPTAQPISRDQEQGSALHIWSDATLICPVARESLPGSWPLNQRLLLDMGPGNQLRRIITWVNGLGEAGLGP